MKRILVIGAVLVLVVGFYLASSYYKSGRAADLAVMAQEESTTFIRPHSPTLGSPDAKVRLVKFTDPACETCATFSPFVKEALEALPGKLQLVIRYTPFHQGADEAVRILEAAKMQGKFWDTLELLYSRQKTWTLNHKVVVGGLWQVVQDVEGLDIERLKSDVKDPRIDDVIEQDMADAETLGVRRTPGFFVNGKPLETFGPRPLANLIKAEIRANYPE